MAHFGQEYLELALASGGRNETYLSARERNLDWAINQVLSPAFAGVDVLVGVPYAPAWISTLGQGDDVSNASWMTHAPAIAGWPLGCLPMGLVAGLPVGMGVAARANDEKGLVRAMAIIERVLDLGDFRPSFIR
jgi:amidase